MSKCDLNVVLDKSDPRFAAGETITGVVEVVVNKECRCNRLTIAAEWNTHGRGNRTGGKAAEQVLFEGVLQPGENLSYSFEIEAPPGPVTYRGHLLNVDWSLRARADIPWAIDPKAETEFLLEPAKGQETFDYGPEYRPADELRAAQNAPMKIAIVMALMVALGGGVLFGFAGLGSGDSESMVVMIFVGGIFLVFCIIAVLIGLRNYLAQKKLGRVEVRLEPPEVRPGGVLNGTLRFRPTDMIEVESIAATLHGQEVVVRGSGTNRTTHRHSLHSNRSVLAEGERPNPGDEFRREFQVAVPEDAPSTFMAHDNKLAWAVEVHISIPGWPDWKRNFPVTVRP